MTPTRFLRPNTTVARATRIVPALLLILTLSAPGVPARAAQAEEAEPARPVREVRLEPTPYEALDPANLDVGEDGIRLTLEQAVEIALRRNLGLVIERYNWIQAREGILQSLGIYDTFLSAFAQTSDTTSPTVEVVEGVPVTQETSDTYDLSLSQLTPWGGIAELSTTAFTQETNSQNVFLNPLYSTSADLDFTQPLLRGFGRLPTERRILVARAAEAQSVELLETQVSQLIQDVEVAYWNLVGTRNQLVVAREAASLAQVLHEQNQVRVDVGTLAPLELIQSEAGIANREEDIIVTEGLIGDAEDNLRLLLNLQQGEYWDVPIVPVTEAETDRIEIDVDEAVATAFRERPEIAAQGFRLDVLDIDRRYFRNQVLPQLDVQLNYGLGGLTGRGETVDPETGEPIAVDGGFSDAYEQIFDQDFDRWQVGVVFSYPLQNRERRAQATIAELALEQGRTELEQLRQQIRTEVRAAARQVETAAKQIESARVSRQLEERNLEAERKRYENGMSSSFRVLEIQEDLTQARSREVSAVASYRRALATYYRTIGLLLEEKGVELEGDTPDWNRYGGWASLWPLGDDDDE